MHPHSHAACIYPTHFVQWSYTHQLLHNQLLHQPAFTQTLFYIKHFCRNPLLHQPAFTQTRFYINPFFHKPPFTPTTSNLHKRAFTHTSFYANQLFDQPAFTQTTFAPTSCTQPLLGPVGQRREGRRNAEGLNNWNKGEYHLAQAHLQMWSSVLAHREPSMVEHTSQRNNANTMSAQSQPNKTLGPWDLVLPFNNLVKSLNCAECDIVIPRHAGTSQESRRVCTLPGATRWLYNRRFYHFFEIFEKELSVVCCPAHPSE